MIPATIYADAHPKVATMFAQVKIICADSCWSCSRFVLAMQGEVDSFAKEVGRLACSSMVDLESTLAGMAPQEILLRDGTAPPVTGDI